MVIGIRSHVCLLLLSSLHTGSEGEYIGSGEQEEGDIDLYGRNGQCERKRFHQCVLSDQAWGARTFAEFGEGIWEDEYPCSSCGSPDAFSKVSEVDRV